MAEDPVANLLRQHFKKVNECLLDKQNFDILTKHSFRSTSDKAIDDSDLHHDKDHLNPKLELSATQPGKNIPTAIQVADTSVEVIDSEEFQHETDFDECSIDGQSGTEVSSFFDDAERFDESLKPVTPRQKPSRKSLLERPQTPLLEMNDSEDESQYYDSIPRKMEGSQKFVMHPEQFQAGDLNFVEKHEDFNVDIGTGMSELLEHLPRKQKIRVVHESAEPEDNQNTFNKELEMYKKDIKLERTIRSLSYNDKYRQNTACKNQASSSSSNQCPKNFVFDNLMRMRENLGSCREILGNECPDYLKNYFGQRKTNVCQRIPQHRDSGHQFESSTDREIHVQGKSIIESSTNDDSNFDFLTLPDNNYVTMNHMEIQKEMMRRIEDMYKPGDGV